MKIADSESIKAGEQELISSIMKRLDPETLAQVATKQLSPEMMEFVHGDMVIRDGQIVYRMDFKATLDISVTFDRDGDLVITGESPEEVEAFSPDAEDTLDTEILDDSGISDMPEPEPEELEAEFPEMPDNTSPDSLEDDMAAVFSRNRDFWNQKSEAAVTDMEADTGHP